MRLHESVGAGGAVEVKLAISHDALVCVCVVSFCAKAGAAKASATAEAKAKCRVRDIIESPNDYPPLGVV